MESLLSWEQSKMGTLYVWNWSIKLYDTGWFYIPSIHYVFNSLYQDSKNNLAPYTFLIPDNYSFNLGDGTITLESNQTALNVWQTIEIQRNGRQGTLVVNGAIHAQVIVF